MKYLKITALLVFLVLLVGCVSMDRIEDNFEEAGYEYQTDASEFIGATLQSIEDDEIEVETHVFVNGIDVAVVLEFESTSDLRNQVDNNETLQEWLIEENNSEYIYTLYIERIKKLLKSPPEKWDGVYKFLTK